LLQARRAHGIHTPLHQKKGERGALKNEKCRQMPTPPPVSLSLSIYLHLLSVRKKLPGKASLAARVLMCVGNV